MSTLILSSNFKERKYPKVLAAFELVRGLSESELETLEILSDVKNTKFFENSLGESKKNKFTPIESIL